MMKNNSKRFVYIGTYTEGGQYFSSDGITLSRGIYRAVYDSDDASFEKLELAAEVVNPSWLTWHPTLSILYAVTENPVDGFQGGAINIFKLDLETKQLDLLTKVDSFGLTPCHVTVDPLGKYIIVSNYRGNDHGGNFALFPLGSDGLPEAKPVLFQGSGKGPNPLRQEEPHAHSSWIDPQNGTILMVDLGLDTVFVRKYNSESRTFQECADLKTPLGSGCRHAVFSPDANVLYIVGELDYSVCVFERNRDGLFEGPIQTVSSLPEDAKPNETPFTASAICIHPSGKFLYVSNRSHGSISVFRCEKTGKRLEPIQIFSVAARIPRFCVIDPAAKSLIVCGQDNASVQTLWIDQSTGRLSNVGSSLTVDSPVCVIFAR